VPTLTLNTEHGILLPDSTPVAARIRAGARIGEKDAVFRT
jgi:hypothetical protein